jgi:hypothetical protein
LEEDSDAGTAELAYRLGFAGGARVVVIEIGRVHCVVEGVGAEGAQEGERQLHLHGRCRVESVQTRVGAEDPMPAAFKRNS